MIWFSLIAVALVAAVLLALLRPLLRAGAEAAGSRHAIVDAFRNQLDELDAELAQGRVDAGEAESARTEITRRMLETAERESRETTGGRVGSWRLGVAFALVAMLPLAAGAIYLDVGTPSAIDGVKHVAASGTGPHNTAELAAAAKRIRAELQKTPDDLDKWVLLARTQATLGRYRAAEESYKRAIALAPKRAQLHAELGEVLVLEAQGAVTAAAKAQFAQAPDDPRSRFYAAEAAAQAGDFATAKRRLQALLASAPPDAPWRKLVKDRLAALAPDLAEGGTSSDAGSGTTPGPSAADIAAAAKMTPQQRQAMIRGMVARLAARMKAHPSDKAGWLRLARAYDVLGEPDKAKAARARAAEAGGETASAAPPAPTPQSAAGSGATPGPSAADIAAAAKMTPQQRQAMIRGMVARLAARMKAHPNDKAGWLRLARAYDVLGEPDKAKAARARAAEAGEPPQTAAAGTPPPTPAGPSARIEALKMHLQADPSDAAGWLKLVRLYRVLGRNDAALGALKQATQESPGDEELLSAYLSALAAGIKDERVTPELVDVASRIHALDPKARDALWYLGIAAAQRGDGYEASKYWSTLLTELPASSRQRKLVEKKLDGLR